MQLHFPRAVLLLVILIGLASWDRRRSRAAGAENLAERVFLQRCVFWSGIIGGLFGALMDQITCTISPDYFRILKELPGRSMWELRLRVADLGFAAGLAPGLAAGICLAVAGMRGLGGHRSRQPVSIRPISIRIALGYLVVPLAAIVVAAPFLIWYQVSRDPGNLQTRLALGLPESAIDRINVTWGIHKAAYLGGVTGTVLATVLLSRRS